MSQEGALAAIRVVDLTRALAGPYCTLLLADHGADVVKIEIPGSGDETREWAPPHMNGVSAYYLAINRNKRSITCDLKSPEGKKILERLIERGDVIVENFSPGVMGRLGFPATLWLQGRYVALASLLWIANAVLMAIGLGMSHEPDRRRHPIALDRVWIGAKRAAPVTREPRANPARLHRVPGPLKIPF